MVRKSLTGEEPIYTGYTTILGNTTQEQCPEAFIGNWFDRSITLGTGRGYSFFGCHHPPSEVFWSFTWECSLSGSEALTREMAADKSKLKAEILKKVQQEGLELTTVLRRIIETGEVLNRIEFYDVTPRSLSSSGRLTSRRDGRITLIGDAAHLMVPSRGQGGNNALVDSRRLVEKLVALAEQQEQEQEQLQVKEENKLWAALSEYETEMSRRTTNEVLESRRVMHSIHEKDPIKVWIRNRKFGFFHWVANSSKFERLLVKALALGVLTGISLELYSRITATPTLELVTRGIDLVKSYLPHL